MTTNIHKVNGFIYVTSEEIIKDDDAITDGFNIWTWRGFGNRDNSKKIILTNDRKLTNVQQLTPEEEAYCKIVDSVEVEFSHKNKHGFFEKKASYKLQLPKKETIEAMALELYPKDIREHYTMYQEEVYDNNEFIRNAFIEGYNEAVKTLYTDSEVLVLLQKRDAYNFEANAKSLQEWETPKQWFNQNKKLLRK